MKFTFSKKFVLKKKKDYKNVILNCNKLNFYCIKVMYFINKIGFSRLGFILEKKKIKKSYTRNTFKRIIREFFRFNKIYFRNFDIIIISNVNIFFIDKKKILKDMNNFLIFCKNLK